MDQTKEKKNVWKKAGKIFIKTIIFLVLFFLLLVGLILVPPVQRFIAQKAVGYLEKKLDTKVSLGKIYIGLPKNIVLENLYVEDRQKDTLLYGGNIKVDIGLFDLISGKVNINRIALDNITANIKRQLPDTAFNFQFIIDAFASKEVKPKDNSDTTSTPVNIQTIELDKIRVVYKDVITGNDIVANLDHFDTRFSEFDLDKMRFGIPAIVLKGLTAKVYQVKPLVENIPPVATTSQQPSAVSPVIDLRSVDLQKIQLDYRNDVAAMYAMLNLGAFNVKPKKIDISNQVVDLGELMLNNTTAAIRLGKADSTLVGKQPDTISRSQQTQGWRIQLASLDLSNNNIQFDNDNAPWQKSGMDYMHLKTDALTLLVNDFLYSSDSIAGVIKKGSFTEQSGFVLQQLQTTFLYAARQAYMKDLYIKTPGTEIKRNLAIQYASLDALQKNIGSLTLDVDLEKSKVQVKDMLTFVPSLNSQPAFANPNATLFLDGNIQGSVADMQIKSLTVSGLGNSHMKLSGTIKGLPDAKKIAANLSIKDISTSRKDLLTLLPLNTLPATITLPEKMSLSGNVKGNMENLVTDLQLRTSSGNAAAKGFLQHITNANTASYDMVVHTQALDLGTILQNKNTLGQVTADFAVKGKGYDPTTANATITAKIKSALIKQYNYNNVAINGRIADQQATLHAAITDPNITIDIDGSADFSTKYPSVQLTGNIDSIKLQALHLTTDQIIYHGKLEGNFPGTNPDSLEGKLFILQSLLVHNQQRITIDSIQLIADRQDSIRFITLNSDIINATLKGRYKLTEMGYIMQQNIEPYFSTSDSAIKKDITPYNFTINANILNRPLLKTFVPDLQRLDSIGFTSHFSDTGWNALLNVPAVQIGANRVDNLILQATTGDSALAATIQAKEIVVGKSLVMYNTSINTAIAHNNIDFALNIKDKTDKEKYNVAGLFQQPEKGVYRFSLHPENIMLNYDKWMLANDNIILINKRDINASNFMLSKGEEKLSINSASKERNAPLQVNFEKFRVATLTGFAQPDSTLADGLLNGGITVNNIITKPVFTSDLTITDLSIKKDTIGNIQMLVDNKLADTYAANITINGRGNDVALSGNYFANNSNFDLLLDIKELPLHTAQAFSAGAIRDASGSVNGKFSVTGTTQKPAVNGDLNFNKASFNLSMLNNVLNLDQQKIAVDNEGIHFNEFQIKDSTGNDLTIDGLAATSDFTHYNLDLDVNADNFRALNSTKKDNKLFYGQLYFNARLNVKGTETAPAVDGRLKINDKTKMTVVLPQNEPGVVDREGVVVFVDKDAPASDSLFMVAYDSLNTSSMQGMDISVNIEVDKAADFTLVVDEANGDFLNVKGEAQLNAGIDPSGKINLAGTYEMEQGSYELTFNFLKRKFDIVKGSKITWQGEPTEAEVDITAKYTTSTAPLDLVKNQLGENVTAAGRNTYLQKIPFDVLLKMSGKLLQPKITFDITLPENKNLGVSNDIVSTVKTKLDMLRQEDAEMNKQVFALLLLNRFVAEDPFKSSASTNASTLVKQSVSKLMTEQLNRLAADLIKGVELNFDVAASDDYTTGERQSRTDLNVGLSKKLLNDRLTVTVGSNFELEGPQNSNQQASNIAGNVSLNYQLSKDGRYMLRGYRKNEYEGVIDGYVVETGLGFMITLDYNKFKDIFKKKRTEEERRELRKKNKEKKEQQKNNKGQNKDK
jgi:translocation and assembly module TamB